VEKKELKWFAMEGWEEKMTVRDRGHLKRRVALSRRMRHVMGKPRRRNIRSTNQERKKSSERGTTCFNQLREDGRE